MKIDSVFSISPSVYKQPVSPRFLPCNGDDSDAAYTSQTWSQSKTNFRARGSLNGFQVDSWGFGLQNNTGSETSITARTVRAKLEYPVGAFWDFTWVGATTKSIVANSTGNLSDVLSVTVPGGAVYSIHWEEVGSAFALCGSGRSLSGEGYGSGTTGMPTLGASYAGSTSGTKICMPNMVTALHQQARPVVVFLGDSNTVDQAQTRDSLGIAGFPRCMSSLANVMKFCMTGNSLANQTALTRRKTVMQNYGAKHAFVLLGTNDLPASGDSSATIITNMDTLAATFAGVGIKPHFMTLPPKSGGAEATRLPLNAYVRSSSGGGNYGSFFELADLVETARDSGTWKTSYTNGDLVHMLWSSTTVTNAVLNPLGNFYSTLQ